MLSVEEATQAVARRSRPLPPRRIPLLQALDCPLAEEIRADRDSPPFEKSLVDGFAVRSADVAGPARVVELAVVEEIMAGSVPTHALGPGESAAIMTGAPLPEGADTVVMREDCERVEHRVRVRLGEPIRAGSNRLARGSEMREGELLLSPAQRLGPIDLGLLASVGAAAPLICPRPRLGILATGDEIVPWNEAPGPSRLRNSNSAHLHALASDHGAEPVDLGVVGDEQCALTQALGRGLRDERLDLLLISGGVSVGDRDLVPATLSQLGVTPVFHKVNLKPGKPLFFGVYSADGGGSGADCAGTAPDILVFGLPGNPVSTIVGFLLFVRVALAIMSGGRAEDARLGEARLVTKIGHRGARTTFHPCRRVDAAGADSRVEPLAWLGSPDLRTVARADGFARLGPGDCIHEAGSTVAFLPIRPRENWP